MSKKSQFRKEFIGTVLNAALARGKPLSNRYIAQRFDVDESTIRNWRETYPEFDRAITHAREILAEEVIAAKHAISSGSRTTTTTKKVIRPDGTTTITTTTRTVVRPRRR
jgi:transposase-like protein